MRRDLIVIASFFVCLATTGAVVADDTPIAPTMSTKLDLAYVSKYVWRGIPQTSSGAFQPAVTLSHASGLSLNFWASEDSDAGKITEHDYTLNYAWTKGTTGMNAGLIYYAFPNTSFASTSEVYACACVDAAFSPTLSVNYDMDEAGGFYTSLSGACSQSNVNLSAKLSFSSAGYNKFWFGVDKAALSDLCLSASMPFPVGKGTLTPSLGYSAVLDSALRNSLSGSGLDTNNLVGSLTFSYGL